MKSPLFLCLAGLTAAACFGQQYSGPGARALTRKVAPQPAPARPAGGVAVGGGVAARPGAPVDRAKVQAQKQKSESDLIKFHRQRAQAGSDNAQYELGVRYLAGNGVEKDEKLGRQWLEKSAKAGNPKAVRKLQELGTAPAERTAGAGTQPKNVAPGK